MCWPFDALDPIKEIPPTNVQSNSTGDGVMMTLGSDVLSLPADVGEELSAMDFSVLTFDPRRVNHTAAVHPGAPDRYSILTTPWVRIPLTCLISW